MTRSIIRGMSRALLLLVVSAAVSVAGAQGKSGKVPPGQAKRQITPTAAVVVTREVLVKQGFEVVRVEHVGVTEVVYYRRGNMGRGRGRGPVERMVVRPSGTVVVF